MMRRPWSVCWLLVVLLSMPPLALGVTTPTPKNASRNGEYPTKSGIKQWVDPATPPEAVTYVNSRGRTWDLVMSDEFNTPNRDFRPGKDHLWTSLDKPDGVNGALEIYSHNMTSTACDDDGTCYYFIKVVDEVTTLRVFNGFKHPPGYENVNFYYRSGMLQSWNKFCFQGGMIEVRAQLPGAISKASGNPDLAKGPTGRVEAGAFYPTWPGIWMMGNLGRAIFSASTNRMWPFSYDRCAEDVFASHNQRISACDSNPGYGLNPRQGRGAPEIDILEGGGTDISSSLQIAPGMPTDFRMTPPDEAIDVDGAYMSCMYTMTCKTKGANLPDVPASHYQKRNHRTWYQGMRYASNNYCKSDAKLIQNYKAVSASVAKGVVENTCNVATCPGSFDVNSDLTAIDNGTDHWGINTNGTCFPRINAYQGAYLCDPDNQHKQCSKPRNDSTPPSDAMKPFNYQMDAISANWPVQLGAYTDYLVYQLEWVTGSSGYVRWMLDGHPLFEVSSDTITNVPQDDSNTNPSKIMIEEPMYVIFNVALSSSWGARPPNPGKPCRGDGSNPQDKLICDEFPMYMKVDYIRVYQDLGNDLDSDNLMQVGCDPKSHPTRQWIEGHIDEYQDDDNPWKEVAGRAFCTSDNDCTVGDMNMASKLITGKCVSSRCDCLHPNSWGGPRCTRALTDVSSKGSSNAKSFGGFGPPVALALGVACTIVLLTFITVWYSVRAMSKQMDTLTKGNGQEKKSLVGLSPVNDVLQVPVAEPKDNYSQNFV